MSAFPIKLAKALLAVQGELHGVVKDSTNPHFKNRYASLEGVISAARPVLQKHGVVFLQAPGEYRDGVATITTSLIHAESGEAAHTILSLPVAKQDPQGVGSAITYACRYSLMAMLGLPPLDDDAQSASTIQDRVPTPQPKAQSIEPYKKMEREIDACKTVEQLRLWGAGNVANKNKLPTDWQFTLSARYEDKMADLKQVETV